MINSTIEAVSTEPQPPSPPRVTVSQRISLAWRGIRDRRVRDPEQAAMTPTVARLQAESATGELAVAAWLVDQNRAPATGRELEMPTIPAEAPPHGFPADIWQHRRARALAAAASAAAAHDRANAAARATAADHLNRTRAAAQVAITEWAEYFHLRAEIYHRSRLLGRRRSSYGWYAKPFEFHTEFDTSELVDGVHLHRTATIPTKEA